MDKLKVIAHIHTDFPEKFGVPRQSGVVKSLTGRIVFEPEFRSSDALKGIEEFDYLWLLWEFEGVASDKFTATVRPPRLGGNETRGVFATRSPFRPNPIGLSNVKLERVEYTADGPEIIVSGIDMRDNTPIFDIKPYLAYADAHPEASDGFAGTHIEEGLEVVFPDDLLSMLPADKRESAVDVLRQDPRPHYHDDPERVYGVSFAGKNIKFQVNRNVLTVTAVE
ncbi:MAG: tRNA (N6-threonylcarbamoyladenosine(37)-N6)-methyltransferase TrmO [Lachnospiraceae bacterium]|nr:tRNA (N6-threonylcarbamoyladenosine(37)-N6)-methyltransferase TrmO [Lachnospiraceae bacterium]